MPNRLQVASVALAEDGAYLAVADIAELASATATEYRIIGGQMVSLHAARHPLDVPTRQTADADLGLAANVLATSELVQALHDRGYALRGGNRLVRTRGGLELAIDVLVPADTSRIRHNRPVGRLFVDEALGLGYALAQPPHIAELEVRLTSGESVNMTVHVPNVVAALCLKVFAYVSRRAERDAVDVWRLLETLNADGVTADTWPATATPRETAELLRRDFHSVRGSGLRAANLTAQQQTRVRLLVARVVGIPK